MSSGIDSHHSSVLLNSGSISAELKFGGPRFNHDWSNRPGLWPMLEAKAEIRRPSRIPANTGPHQQEENLLP
jgi:hypothetical protein